jgi:hypothetical protein
VAVTYNVMPIDAQVCGTSLDSTYFLHCPITLPLRCQHT